jgi:hypothetical protein
MSLLKLQVEAVRCRLDGRIYAMKSMMKAAVRRAGQVGDQPVRPLTLVIVPRAPKTLSRHYWSPSKAARMFISSSNMLLAGRFGIESPPKCRNQVAYHP